MDEVSVINEELAAVGQVAEKLEKFDLNMNVGTKIAMDYKSFYMLQGMSEKLRDVLDSHIEEKDSAEVGQTPSMDSAIAGILETIEEAASFALREMAGTAIKDGLQELVTNMQTRESAAEY